MSASSAARLRWRSVCAIWLPVHTRSGPPRRSFAMRCAPARVHRNQKQGGRKYQLRYQLVPRSVPLLVPPMCIGGTNGGTNTGTNRDSCPRALASILIIYFAAFLSSLLPLHSPLTLATQQVQKKIIKFDLAKNEHVFFQRQARESSTTLLRQPCISTAARLKRRGGRGT
jgi:hypothetical protein